MEITKHTPKPWKPVRSLTCGHLRAGHNYKKDPREEWTDADIQLIEAAPDLLEACKAVAETIKDLGPLWIRPPYQAEAVHETAYERLIGVIELASMREA